MPSKFQTPEKFLESGRTHVLRLDRAVVRKELVKRLTKAKRALADAADEEVILLERYRRKLVRFAQRHLRTTFMDTKPLRRVLYRAGREIGHLCHLKPPLPPKLLRPGRRDRVVLLEAKIRHLDALDPKKEIRMSPPVYAHYLGDDDR